MNDFGYCSFLVIFINFLVISQNFVVFVINFPTVFCENGKYIINNYYQFRNFYFMKKIYIDDSSRKQRNNILRF